MATKSSNKAKQLLGGIIVIIAILALALPAQAAEPNFQPNFPPTRTPVIEINPDASHHSHANLEAPPPMSALELAVSCCSGGLPGSIPARVSIL